MVEIRHYHPPRDASDLWRCKREFERGLGKEGDAATAAAYRAKLTKGYRDRYLDWAQRCVDTEPAAIQVAVDRGSIVGYVFVLPETHAMIWDGAVLNEIYVDQAHRGTGVADRLLEAAVQTARHQNLPQDRLILDVHPENERARAFYQRHGFETWGELVAREL